MHIGTQLKVLATNWGFNGSLDAFCAKAKDDGYNGIEIWWPMEKKDQEELVVALNKYELDAGFLTGAYESNFNDHFESFKKMVYAAATNKIVKPLFINCHAGKDYFTYEQHKTIIEYTVQLANDTGVKICHETHRSRILFSATSARKLMEDIPALRLTFDVSHWCNVHESFLEDQQETLEMALQRADHIHARVGHPQGPQVNDPLAPEWEQAVNTHIEWWKKIAAIKQEKGEILTVLTEFGPPDYMPTLPYTKEPVADQWAINVHMMQLVRDRL